MPPTAIIPESRPALLLVLLFLVAWVAAGQGIRLSEAVIEQVGQKYGEAARLRVVQWQTLLSTAQNTDAQRLKTVNDFFNQVPYRSDAENWDTKDYWATPIEMLGNHAADCEDYAIAKYFSLRELGVSAEKLRLTYVKAVEINQAHMVLAYYPQPDAEPLILDNLKPEISPASQRKDLVPVYSFNAEGLWLSVSRGSGRRLGDASKIRLWQDLQEKMKQELQQ